MNEPKNTYSGHRLKIFISDELEDLKRRYTPEQLKKMWEDAYHKPIETNNKVIITGTPKK